MKARRVKVLLAVAVAMSAAALVYSKTTQTPRIPAVKLVRTPDGGIQPQTVVDSHGVLHMIYFTGKAGAGNIEYVQRAPGAKVFSKPIRVNSQPDSAVAVGTVRGPQLAVGRNGRVYVVWFGSSRAKPRRRSAWSSATTPTPICASRRSAR